MPRSEQRPALARALGDAPIAELDRRYQAITAATARRTPRAFYRKSLRSLANSLASAEATHAVALAQPRPDGPDRLDLPDFSPLVADPRMQAILAARWGECDVCVVHGAPLAAAVMIGGLLEGLFLARILSADKLGRDRIFNSDAALIWALAQKVILQTLAVR